MEKLKNEIVVPYADESINGMLKNSAPEGKSFSTHYNQNEEFFIRLNKSFTLPGFPIHHDIEKTRPDPRYLTALKSLMEQILPESSTLFSGLTYYFEPTEIFHPCFFQIYKIKDTYYLYLLRIDLVFRTHEGEIEKKGSNDFTHTFSSRHLFLESDFIPLESINVQGDRIRSFLIDQHVSETWIGETGRGYFIQGIWMDSELSKFFSKLLLPTGKRAYPYYPFSCKYRTICHSAIDLTPGGRKKHLLLLRNGIEFLLPRMGKIQGALKKETFSPEITVFQELKKEVPLYWNKAWETLVVKPYLNEKDMKEYSIELDP